MVLALSACGDGKKENGQTPQEQPKQEDSMLGEGSADSGTAAPGQDDHTVTAPDTTPGKNPAAADDTRPSAGTDLEDMAEQARVHDRDGGYGYGNGYGYGYGYGSGYGYGGGYGYGNTPQNKEPEKGNKIDNE